MEKIIEYHGRYKPHIGGGETHVASIVQNIPDFEFIVLTNAIRGCPSEEKVGNNIIIKRIHPIDYNLTGFKISQLNRLLFPYIIFSDIRRIKKIKRHLIDEKYDLVHFHGIPILSTSIPFVATNIIKFPIFNGDFNFSCQSRPKLVTLHQLFQKVSKSDIIKKYEDSFIQQFDTIICVDKYIEQYLRERTELSGNAKIYYIPNSVNVSSFHFSKSIEREHIIVGFAGRLESSRGMDFLDQFINSIPENIRLHIIGAGNQLALKKFQSKTDLSKVTFFPNVKNEDMPQYLSNIDILFNPVRAEGISRITLEAMACGRPVIMIDKGCRYPVIHEKTGFLIQENLNDLLLLLEHINANRELLNTMGKNARDLVEREFSDEVVIPQIKKIYEELLHESR